MAEFIWPAAWVPSSFEMRILNNEAVFQGRYTPATQQVDLFGERWGVSIELPAIGVKNSLAEGTAREAFFDRLAGRKNRVRLWHLRQSLPRGTLRGGANAIWHTSGGATATWHTTAALPVTWTAGTARLNADVAQLAGSAVISCQPGKSLEAGDMISIGGQLVRILAWTSSDNAGLMPIEFRPRMRVAVPAFTRIDWNAPSALFMLATPEVVTRWKPGMVDPVQFDLIEDF